MDEGKITLSAVGELKDKHLTITRDNLRIGQCFSTMARFEESVRKFPGIASFLFVVETGVDAVASGSVRVRFARTLAECVLGTWRVKNDGTASVRLGDCIMSNLRGDELQRQLDAAWRDGVVTAAIRAARRLEAERGINS